MIGPEPGRILRAAVVGRFHQAYGLLVPPSGVNLRELLTEPREVTRWGIALASVVLVLLAVLVDRFIFG